MTGRQAGVCGLVALGLLAIMGLCVSGREGPPRAPPHSLQPPLPAEHVGVPQFSLGPPSPGDAPPHALPSETPLIRGRCVDTCDVPVADAIVRVLARSAGDSDLIVGTCTTKSDGTFEISQDPRQEWLSLKFDARGAATRVLHLPPVRPSHYDTGDVILGAGAVVRGRVVDHTGPVRDCIVRWALHTPLGNTGPAPHGTVRTDGQGDFLIDGLPPGQFVFFASMPDSSMGSDPVILHVRPGQREHHVTLLLGAATRSLVVVDGDRLPVPGVRLFALAPTNLSAPLELQTRPGDAPGALTVVVPLEGDVQCLVRAEQYVSETVILRRDDSRPPVVTLVPGLDTVTLRLTPPGSPTVLVGVVKWAGADGHPLPALAPRSTSVDRSTLDVGPVRPTDRLDRGRRRILVVDPVVNRWGMTSPITSDDLAAGARHLPVAMGAMEALKVRCILDGTGEPVVGATVALHRASGRASRTHTPWGYAVATASGLASETAELATDVTGPDGFASLSYVPGFEYRVRVTKGTLAPAQQAVQTTGEVVVVMRAGSTLIVEGGSTSGDIQALSESGEVHEGQVLDGHLVFTPLPDGIYFLAEPEGMVWASGIGARQLAEASGTAQFAVDVRPGVTRVRLPDTRSAWVSGDLPSWLGEEGLLVGLVPDGSRSVALPPQVRIGGDGVFVLGPVPAGRYVLQGWAELGQAVFEEHVDLVAGHTVVSLRPPLSRVTVRRGSRYGGALAVRLRSGDTRGVTAALFTLPEQVRQRTIVIKPGGYIIEIRHAVGSTWETVQERTVEFEAGEAQVEVR